MKSRIKNLIAKFLDVVLDIWWGLPLLSIPLLRVFKRDMADRILTHTMAKRFTRTLSRFSRYYCMIELLPKNAEDIVACKLLTDTKQNEYAIVIQGPVLNGFTAESIKIYRKLLPKAYIIVSAWKIRTKSWLQSFMGSLMKLS